MKIALVGYGKMGRRIHALAEEYGFSVPLILDVHNNAEGRGITSEAFQDIDVAIDFSHPDLALLHLNKISELGIPLVIGTTGWFNDRAEIERLCQNHNTRVMYGSNFSLGVQLFIKLIAKAGELFGQSRVFDAALHEVHHTQKADAPGGTAKTLANTWLTTAGSGKKPDFHIPDNRQPDQNSFYVTSQRLGSVYGEHQLRINSPFDDIEITHRARSRDAFASGAIRSAEWLTGQKTGFYLIEEVVEQISL